MRLLRRCDAGECILAEHLRRDDTIPPYAILFHTWGADPDEVTFEDMTNGTGKDKAGCEKIRFCGEQARQEGLQYFFLIPAASTRPAKLSSRTLSTPCSAGTATPPDATFRGSKVRERSSELWYCKVRKMPTRSRDSTRKDEGVRCLFRGYLRYATVFGVVIVESAVGVPLRWVFRYERMDVRKFCISMHTKSPKIKKYTE